MTGLKADGGVRRWQAAGRPIQFGGIEYQLSMVTAPYAVGQLSGLNGVMGAKAELTRATCTKREA